jgi:hypothetical protein
VTALQASHGSSTDVIVNGNLVSQYFNDATISLNRDKAETSAFKQTYKSYVGGLIDGVATFTGLFDPNIDLDLYTYMTQITGANGNYWASSPQGFQGSAAFGNVITSYSGQSTKYEPKSALSSANTITAEVQMSQNSGGVDRGYVYHPWQTEVASGNTSSIDFGSTSSAAGGVLVLHAFSDTASLVINLQDSADNSTFANVTGYTISATNSTIAAYRYPAGGVTPTGTVRRYTRITWTGTGTFLAMFSRK